MRSLKTNNSEFESQCYSFYSLLSHLTSPLKTQVLEAMGDGVEWVWRQVTIESWCQHHSDDADADADYIETYAETPLWLLGATSAQLRDLRTERLSLQEFSLRKKPRNKSTGDYTHICSSMMMMMMMMMMIMMMIFVIFQVSQSTLWVSWRPAWWPTATSLLEAFPPGCFKLQNLNYRGAFHLQFWI